jgi:hypothetical protein
MTEIARIKKGNATLVHSHVIDWTGILRDALQIEITQDTHPRTLIYPFIGKIKVRTLARDTNLLDATTVYSHDEYQEMLDEQLSKL